MSLLMFLMLDDTKKFIVTLTKFNINIPLDRIVTWIQFGTFTEWLQANIWILKSYQSSITMNTSSIAFVYASLAFATAAKLLASAVAYECKKTK